MVANSNMMAHQVNTAEGNSTAKAKANTVLMQDTVVSHSSNTEATDSKVQVAMAHKVSIALIDFKVQTQAN